MSGCTLRDSLVGLPQRAITNAIESMRFQMSFLSSAQAGQLAVRGNSARSRILTLSDGYATLEQPVIL